MDERVIKAALVYRYVNIADIIIIGKPCIEIDLKNIEIINPKECELTSDLINKLYELRKDKGMTLEKAEELLLNDYMYYACMLVKIGYTDSDSGVYHSTSNTLSPFLQIIKTKTGVKLVSAFFLMEVPNCE